VNCQYCRTRHSLTNCPNCGAPDTSKATRDGAMQLRQIRVVVNGVIGVMNVPVIDTWIESLDDEPEWSIWDHPEYL